ncbi:putative receptor-like protein kinase [Prunus yedoensis var. nudiflora]|uniref:Putative receptor-like protein kinase n=1 Tax=Prunus yedoensis var. nudiflora TaxID=2094558 RepID=A0A314ZPB6_PRUYE|nr:putative receptor-like protein kinase [Prunus yedoensis var. nudiflora]
MEIRHFERTALKRISKFLKHIPASASEYRARTGLDPTTHAEVIIDSSTGSIADFACEVEITECEPLPDGRFYLEIESRRRFRIIRSWDQDGYRVAEIEWVHDIYPPEGSRERGGLQELTNNAAEYARLWIGRVKEQHVKIEDDLRDFSAWKR